MPVTQIVKWGNSLALRIPKLVAEEAGVREGDPIEVAARAGQINVRRPKDHVPSLRKLVAQIRRKDRYGEVKTGAARGKERVRW